MAHPIKTVIPDLRINHDQKAYVENGKATGTIYRKDNVVQIWWECDILGRPFDNSDTDSIWGKNGRETWTFPSIIQAENGYIDKLEENEPQ